MEDYTVPSEELGKALYDLLRDYEEGDRISRQRLIRFWKRLDYFWHGIQYLLDNDDSYSLISPELNPDQFNDSSYYTKVYNIFKAHGESIIAALSVDYPGVVFPPEDAQNEDDVETSKAFEIIHDIVRKQNNGKLLLVKSLYYLYIAGVVYARTYSKEHKKFGTYTVPKYRNEDVKLCPDCQAQMTGESCPSCGYSGPGIDSSVSSVSGSTEENKARQLISIHSPLEVFVPSWVTETCSIPLIRLSEDLHLYQAKSEFPDIADKIVPFSDPDQWERWARRPYFTTYEDNKLTVKKSVWFSPSSYFGLKDEFRAQCEKEYPDGLCIYFINDIPAKIESESWEDVWAISVDPRSRHILSDPIGAPLLPIQEVTNELFNLTLQTVEEGIPQVFVDTEVVDLKAYGESESLPGQLYPAKPKPGKSLKESFETIKAATVSQEIKEFANTLEHMGQFVVGDFPSIFGGELNGSRTAAEYAMSGNKALQRLSTSWMIVTFFWADLMGKTCNQFAQNMKTDERVVQKKGSSYINVWVRKSELSGKIGNVEPESVEHFPTSSSQKRDFLSSLFQLKDPNINQMLFHPMNRTIIAKYAGFNDLYVPGEIDQNKQYAELEALFAGVPAQGPDGSMVPSIRTDPKTDDDSIHIQTIKAVLNAERGRLLRVENPNGYENALAHLEEHQMNVQGKTALPFENTAPGQNPETSATTTGA